MSVRGQSNPANSETSIIDPVSNKQNSTHTDTTPNQSSRFLVFKFLRYPCSLTQARHKKPEIIGWRQTIQTTDTNYKRAQRKQTDGPKEGQTWWLMPIPDSWEPEAGLFQV